METGHATTGRAPATIGFPIEDGNTMWIITLYLWPDEAAKLQQAGNMNIGTSLQAVKVEANSAALKIIQSAVDGSAGTAEERTSCLILICRCHQGEVEEDAQATQSTQIAHCSPRCKSPVVR